MCMRVVRCNETVSASCGEHWYMRGCVGCMSIWVAMTLYPDAREANCGVHCDTRRCVVHECVAMMLYPRIILCWAGDVVACMMISEWVRHVQERRDRTQDAWDPSTWQ